MSSIHCYDDLLASFTPRCGGLGFTLRGLVWFYFQFYFLAEVSVMESTTFAPNRITYCGECNFISTINPCDFILLKLLFFTSLEVMFIFLCWEMFCSMIWTSRIFFSYYQPGGYSAVSGFEFRQRIGRSPDVLCMLLQYELFTEASCRRQWVFQYP